MDTPQKLVVDHHHHCIALCSTHSKVSRRYRGSLGKLDGSKESQGTPESNLIEQTQNSVFRPCPVP